MFNSEQLQEKWNPVLDCDGLDGIKDTYRKAVTAAVSYTHLTLPTTPYV